MIEERSDFLESVLLVRIEGCSRFGTGFIVCKDASMTWVVTCAHVVENLDGAQIYVEDIAATLYSCGESGHIDLAVLVVDQELPGSALQIHPYEKSESQCYIPGFCVFSGDYTNKKGEAINAELGHKLVFKGVGEERVDAWRIRIMDDIQLEEGYSGSPIICKKTGLVMGVISHEEREGQHGYAVPIKYLKKIWPDVPKEILPSLNVQHNLSTLVSCVELTELAKKMERERVDHLRIKYWCREKFEIECHKIPLDDGILSIMLWLRDKGKLLNSVPLCDFFLLMIHEIGDQGIKIILKEIVEKISIFYGCQIIVPKIITNSNTKNKKHTLTFEIFPVSGINRTCCNIQGWLLEEDKPKAIKVYPLDDNDKIDLTQQSNIENLVETINTILVKNLGVKAACHTNVIVEFVLSRELLNEPINQWENVISRPLSTMYPVVFRSRDRLVNQSWQAQWGLAWQAMTENECSKGVPCWRFKTSELRKLVLKVESGMCVSFPEVVDVLNGDDKTNPIIYFIRAGGSAAIWPVEKVSNESLQELEDLIEHNPIAELPIILRKRRLEEWSEEEDTSKLPLFRWCVFLDDPSRVVSSAILKAPVK